MLQRDVVLIFAFCIMFDHLYLQQDINFFLSFLKKKHVKTFL